ncbi:glycosyltransferase family 2 protein [Vibrio splendidus]|uniref:glycosyltransferase family 2 protein n=1 Tax=Vibrio splendidus TaxID=29497 RepID=UPI00352F2AD9
MNKHDIKFSVVIPLYNKGYSIISCLESIYGQLTPVDEVIIIDDGSSDDGHLKVQEYIDSGRVKNLILLRQNNQGVSISRNRGVSVSSNPWVAFLDADDEWKPNFISDIKSLIVKYPNCATYSSGHLLNINGHITKSVNPFNRDYTGLVDNFFKRSKYGSILNSSKVVVSKDMFNKVGKFPENVAHGEDLFLWIQFAVNYSMAYTSSRNVMINIVEDSSRLARNTTIPYPLEYYLNKKIPPGARGYIRTMLIKHFLGAANNNNKIQQRRLTTISRINYPIVSFFLMVLERMPSIVVCFIYRLINNFKLKKLK